MGETKGMTLDDLKQRMGILDAARKILRRERKTAREQMIKTGDNLETKQSENKYNQAGKEFTELGKELEKNRFYKETLQFLIDNYSVLKTRYGQIDIKNNDELQDWVDYFEKYYSDAVEDVHDFFFWWTESWKLRHPVYQDPVWEKYSHNTNMRAIKQLNEQLEHFLELKNHEPGHSGFAGDSDSETEPNKRPRHQLLQKPLIRF